MTLTTYKFIVTSHREKTFLYFLLITAGKFSVYELPKRDVYSNMDK